MPLPNDHIFVLSFTLSKQGLYFRAKVHTTSNVGQVIISYEAKQRDERGPEFACEIWVESSLAWEMRVITLWHRAMCLCPVQTLILHSAETCIPLSQYRKAYRIPQMSCIFGRGVTGHRLWWGSLNTEVQAPVGLWQPQSNLKTLL